MKFAGSFGDWLKQRRKAFDLTQQELADQVGCSVVTIRKIEGNLARPSKQIADLLADVLAIASEERAAFVAFARRSIQGLSSQPAIETVVQPPHNLPLQPTPFVGRTEELARIAEQINDPDCRLLTLLGVGGVGKTRLALEAASVINSEVARAAVFPDGVYFVPLQPLTSTDLILSAIAEGIGFQFYAGSEPFPQLIDFLYPRALLLILDNFEHLLDGADLVSDLLANAPKIKILATSREALNLREEWLYPVGGMSYPDTTHNGDLDDYSAVRLFTQSARRTHREFSLAKEQDAVVRICQLVEGMPLALEMTAAWLRRFPTQEIIRQIERGLDILETPVRNMPDRHRSMRAVFDHSRNLLSEAERDVFKKLSVFRGGFKQEAAERIAGASLGTLLALVDKSLLRLDATGRYDLHELVRQYAEEQLNTSLEASRAVCEAHFTYYVEYAHQRDYAIQVQDSKAAYADLAIELKNLRSAWEWGIDQVYAEELNKLSGPLLVFHTAHCLYHEGAELFGNAVPRLRGTSGGILGTAMDGQAWCLQFLGHYAEAKAIYEESLTIGRERGRLGWLQFVLLRLSEIAIHDGDYERAKHYGEESLEIQRKLGASWEPFQTYTIANLGRIAGLSGDHEEARRLLHEAAVIAEKFNNPIGAADARNFWGQVELSANNYKDAKRVFEENLALEKRTEYPRGIVVSLIGLGEATCKLREYRESRRYFIEALTTTMKINGIPMALDALTGIVELFIREENPEQAVEPLALVVRHHATEHDTKTRAQALLAQLETRLSPDVIRDTLRLAQPSQLEAAVQTLIDGRR